MAAHFSWPGSRDDLVRLQALLSAENPPPWQPGERPLLGAVFVCFGRGESGPGHAGDPGWAAATLLDAGELAASATVTAAAGAPYEPGLLALREGPLLEAAVRALPHPPDVLLVDATGRDHPRRAGLALHVGAVLGLPTVGVTHRPLLASGREPGPARGDRSPLLLDGELVGYWLRTRPGARPLAVHAGWRTTPDIAVGVVCMARGDSRTPEPLRLARQLAREARSAATRG